MPDMIITSREGPDICDACRLKKRAAILKCVNIGESCDPPSGVSCTFDTEIQEALAEKKARESKKSFTVIQKTVPKRSITVKKPDFTIKKN